MYVCNRNQNVCTCTSSCYRLSGRCCLYNPIKCFKLHWFFWYEICCNARKNTNFFWRIVKTRTRSQQYFCVTFRVLLLDGVNIIVFTFLHDSVIYVFSFSFWFSKFITLDLSVALYIHSVISSIFLGYYLFLQSTNMDAEILFFNNSVSIGCIPKCI